ncbi:Baeyer-Villiger monooxygenase [Paramyrothecium foliicola]|nr:Baeyer-Villiger monooxygenase [Paramyrothecium foliicola]
MPFSTNEPRLLVIGAGVAGIALAARLRFELGYENFTVIEREADIGGTWFLHTYPGVGCDVDSHLYSFSFNPNPNWSQRFAEQPEILKYLHDTAVKFGVRPHVRLKTEVIKADWLKTKNAEMLVSCVGTISIPKDCNISKHENDKSALFHSARWDHSVDYTNKRVAIVGNGCSGAQIMPRVAERAGHVVQFQRSPQWINDRPNPRISEFRKWCFRSIPLYARIYRCWLWRSTDTLHGLYITGDDALECQRAQHQSVAEEYMKRTAPRKYHDILIPKFPLGCKRRVFDPGYLTALHRPNVETTRRDLDFDAVVLSTGFKIQEFLSPIEVFGTEKSLNEHWKDTGGAQAYKATFVHGFPNFGIVFGLNAFPAHNSVIYTNETQVEYIIKTLIRPVLRGYFEVLDVKQAAEDYHSNHVQEQLKSMV